MSEDSGLEVRVEVPDVAVGIVYGGGCEVGPSPSGLERALDDAVARAAEREDTQEHTKAVRGMLRHGKYKPTGRGKPASEYLLGAARDSKFPRINNLVDINNLVSLETLLPVSVVDIGQARTRRFVVRHGREGESYVFNDSGQEIDLEDLLLVATADDDRPCANPVKDCMDTKVVPETREVMAVLYAPDALVETLQQATERFAEALSRWGGAERVDRAIVQI
ncbi:MAG: phenylalanine--tRNA ligase beta subunit-related protein [Polyangiales bacterium]